MGSILSWSELEKIQSIDIDRIHGITNSYSELRLFNHKEIDAELIFYRDRHAWCPYCQKIWLWLEFKRIPYKIKKINMYCYGKKEEWYLRKVSSGKLPAIEFKGKVISESDEIISFLELEFGSLGSSIHSNKLEKTRIIERTIFRKWCEWLCRDNIFSFESSLRKNSFKKALSSMEVILEESSTGYIDPSFERDNNLIPGTGDVIFIPYIERINASLCYYKGFNLRKEFPLINKWLSQLENESIYLGTQGDFHTHSHDLPPQMGGCFKEINNQQIKFSELINTGKGLADLEINRSLDLTYFSKFALFRVLKHKNNILEANPCPKVIFDKALRCSLTYMMTGEINKVDNNCAIGLRFLRNRISVPRDMPILSARLLRQSLERIASLCDSNEIDRIPTKHRFDQNPIKFLTE